MNIALYMRLSKEDGINDESKSISSQRFYLNNYLDGFDYQSIYEYIDDGYSGTNFNRPAFKRMLKDIEEKKIDVVITKDSSRLGRNISWVTYYIEEYFPSKKIRYISIDDNYDSKNYQSTESELLILKSFFNDYYCKDISKKIRSSLKSRKQQGQFTGWKAPYGYKRRKDDYHYLEIDEKASFIIKKIFDLAYQDNTPSSIAKILNDQLIPSPAKYAGFSDSKWSTKTIKDILTNPTYIGNLAQGKRKKINYKIKNSISLPKEEWIIIENANPSIIDKKIFEEVQTKLSKYHNVKNNKSKKEDFINIMYCKECGSRIGLNKRGNQRYCVCNNYKKNNKYKTCTPHTFNYNNLRTTIIEEINNDLDLYSKEVINKLKKDSRFYLYLINKIYLTESGELELLLNYVITKKASTFSSTDDIRSN